jgi:hypothetical protein
MSHPPSASATPVFIYIHFKVIDHTEKKQIQGRSPKNDRHFLLLIIRYNLNLNPHLRQPQRSHANTRPNRRMPRQILLQILHHFPHDTLLISLEAYMIAIDPKNCFPAFLHTGVFERELDIGESLVNLLEEVGFHLAGLRVPAA